ncbi:MAG: ABC transporter permease [Candidatus Promineifilaceae bacterium]
MATIEGLKPVSKSRWLHGFNNMLRKENYSWWGTRKWWINILIWTAMINGFIALILWVIPLSEPEEIIPLPEALQLFLTLFGAFATIGVIVIAQGAIVREKQTGTAEWVMSSPVSHGAFILAKLIANALAILVIIVLLQSLLFYAQISLREGALLPFAPFAAATALVSLSLVFFLTLTLMLGTIFSSRGPVIGIAIAVSIGQDIAAQLLAKPIPWLPNVVPQRLLEFAQLAINEQPIPSNTALIVASSLSVLFILVAIWRFGREEF